MIKVDFVMLLDWRRHLDPKANVTVVASKSTQSIKFKSMVTHESQCR